MKGKIQKAKGQVKEQVGKATNNRSMQAEGKMDRAAGTVKEKASETKNAVRDGATKMKEKMHRR